MTRKKPLSTADYKVVFGGTFGDPAPKSKAQIAIEQANEADAIRRRDKPTADELLAALQSRELSDTDIEHIRNALKGIARSAGAPKESENARLARDYLLYSEYCSQLGKGLEKPAAKIKAARKFGVGTKTVEAAITKAHKLFSPKRRS